MKKIGILCFWGVPNYGAWAQAYALNRVVKSIVQDKYTVEHINYLHPRHENSYYASDFKLHNNFNYNYDLINHSVKLSGLELQQENYDVIITGSDAIWDFSIDVFGEDWHLIGKELSCKGLIAYAPSFGMMDRNSLFHSCIKEGLERYGSISVRDENSADIVEKLIGYRPQMVLDPVLLWDFQNDPIVKEPWLGSYLLVYGDGFTGEFIEETIRFAHERRLKLVSIGFINKWCDISFRLTELRGDEWIGWFSKAEYVATCMFHGFMMGLVYHKQIKFCMTDYVEKRCVSLLRQLGGGRYMALLKTRNAKEIFSEELDDTIIISKLNDLRGQSIRYLTDALGGDNICRI